MHQFFDFIKYIHVDTYLNHIEGYVNSEGNQNFLIWTSNPVKLCLLVIDSLVKINYKFKVNQFKVDSIKEQIEDLLRKIIKNISSAEEMKCMIKQKDLD